MLFTLQRTKFREMLALSVGASLVQRVAWMQAIPELVRWWNAPVSGGAQGGGGVICIMRWSMAGKRAGEWCVVVGKNKKNRLVVWTMDEALYSSIPLSLCRLRLGFVEGVLL